MHVAVKALVPIRMSVMWKFYTGNRPEKHSSGLCVYQDLLCVAILGRFTPVWVSHSD
jgi:hypothetical protein